MHTILAKQILSSQNGMNIYRGCTHGCIYCDARSDCYWQESERHDFEDVEVKMNAPELLNAALLKKRNRCMIGTGSMCDPYMHCEKQLGLTRRCLEIILKHNCGLAIQTKSDLILRDLDLLCKINERAKCIVEMTLTTYDDSLCRIVEPNVCVTSRRVEVLKILKERGIETVVWFTPTLPFINDTEENIRGILDYCIDSKVYGLLTFGLGLTLRSGDREYFYKKLDEHFPGLKRKYISTYGNSYALPLAQSDRFCKIIYEQCHSHNIVCDESKIFEYMRTLDTSKDPNQLELF